MSAETMVQALATRCIFASGPSNQVYVRDISAKTGSGPSRKVYLRNISADTLVQVLAAKCI